MQAGGRKFDVQRVLLLLLRHSKSDGFAFLFAEISFLPLHFSFAYAFVDDGELLSSLS